MKKMIEGYPRISVIIPVKNEAILLVSCLESLKKLAKDLLGLTAAQIAVALGEGSLVEVEHEA